MPQMFVDDELYCPACGHTFKTAAGTRSHLTQSVHCAWYRKGKNPKGRRRTMRTPSPIPELDVVHDAPVNAEDIPVIDVIEEWDNDIFQFIPLDPNKPGPSSAPRTYQHLSDEDNDRVIDSHPTTGKVIRMNDNLHTKWKKSFGLGIDPDSDGNIEMGGSDLPNGFAPFASELDWRIAEWVIKDSPGYKAFNCLLNIPGVREKLGLLYTNIRGLHRIVDSIPDRAGVWTSKTLSFPDRPTEKYLVRYRDPLTAIRALLGHAKDIVYVPKKVFSDAEQENRVYNEMWTGKWWTAVQTKLPVGAALASDF
ncbi:hypothetical protein C8R45DRAFT_1135107 [Mycena sanguinolenta]|nr:hypothetical protein C8R45DRAFT_1135107 [Mycena sanguinolenta]